MQRWLHLLVSVTVVTSLGFLVYGLLEHWGAAQWGSYGQSVGSAVTFAAVVVALREAFRADRARLVDHELSRRREAISALSELWAGIDRMSAPLLMYSGFLEFLPHTFDPEVPLSDHELEGGMITDEKSGRAIQLRSIDFMNQWGSEIGTTLVQSTDTHERHLPRSASSRIEQADQCHQQRHGGSVWRRCRWAPTLGRGRATGLAESRWTTQPFCESRTRTACA